MLHPKFEQARISANILSCYNGVQKLTTPIINQIEFEKSVIEDKILFYPDEVMKSWSSKMIDSLNKEKDEIKKSELNNNIQKQMESLCKVNVVFDKVVKSVYVDIINAESKTYKDNSLTKKLNLAGKHL